MDAEEGNAEQNVHEKHNDGFSLPVARDVVSRAFRAVELLGPDNRKKAALSSLSEFSQQLDRLEALYGAQNSVALEFGLNGALADASTGAVGHVAGLAADQHAVTITLPEWFWGPDNWAEREHVRALAWQAGCPPEAVRKELRAHQKTFSDRFKLATKRSKTDGHPLLHSTRSTPTQGSPAPSTNPATAPPGNNAKSSTSPAPVPGQLPQQQQQQAPPAVSPVVDEGLYCLDEAEEATCKAQLAKLRTLLDADTGGICGSPISVVGVFQQLMAACTHWRVRRVALEAMSRSSLEVLWRLLQNSRVLDSLHSWLQEALTDQQSTMMRLLLSTMACLPMRRDLLKGSRLEASLEGLANDCGQGGQRGSTTAAAAGAVDASGRPIADTRQRFGAAAAAVLADWRKDPDHATVLRRAGAVVVPAATSSLDSAAAAAASSAAPASSNTGPAPPVPGSRLLGAAAARKRPLPTPRPQWDPRAGPRPRMGAAAAGDAVTAAAATAGNGPLGGGGGGGSSAAANGSGGAAQSAGHTGRAGGSVAVSGAGSAPAGGGGGGGGPKQKPSRPPVATPGSLAAKPATGVVDMTAKLGEKGPADPDVVAGFRSRFGDGSVRRSQLVARPGRAAAPHSGVREASPGPGPGPGLPALAAGAATAATAPGAAAAAAGAVDAEPGPDDLARLRAERAIQRQMAALQALQAEARRHPEVAAAEREYQEERSRRAARPKSPPLHPEEIRHRLAALRETVPWVGPPPELRLPPDHLPTGTGEDSLERLERLRDREQRPKVSYPDADRVPSCPVEPPVAELVPPGPPRLIPWWPSLDSETGAAEWHGQNLELWRRGIRRAGHVLPPALLHKHLGLPPAALPPEFALVPPLQGTAPSAAAAWQTPTPLGSGPFPADRQQPQPLQPPPPPQPQSQYDGQQHAPVAVSRYAAAPAAPQPFPTAAARPAGTGDAAMPMPPPLPPQHAGLTALPPPPPMSVVPSWEAAAEPPASQPLLSQPPPVIKLPVLLPAQAPPPVAVISLLPVPQPAPLLHAAATAAPQQPQQQPPPPPHMHQQQHLPERRRESAPLPYEHTQQSYNYGHANGHPVPGVGGRQYPPPAADDRPPYGYPVNGDLPPPPHGKYHAPPPAYQQLEPGQDHHHHDAHTSYGETHHHRLHNGRHASPGRDEGGYGSSATYGRQYGQQEQQRRDYTRGWGDTRERGGYMQGREYGGR